ncbi:MAG TPA: endonuclease/exonuclease/phosphatase family protein [Desulfomonilia bacterium]|jgi:endonuclease/exonuclease/phosphatase family metal-dependent hydrolase
MNSVQKFPAVPVKQQDSKVIRLLSYNFQVGISTNKSMDYFTSSWKHFMPHTRRIENMKRLARFIRDYDIVGLQELDGGSFRSGFVNQAEYLAMAAGFDCWYDKINRNMGLVAKHSMGVLSRFKPENVERHDLPGFPGRGCLTVTYGKERNIGIILAHLSLGKRARLKQVDFLCELVSQFSNAVLMGDLNCIPKSEEIEMLKKKAGLKDYGTARPSYPSWAPVQRLDHILVSDGLKIKNTGVLPWSLSDHLPISMEIEFEEKALDTELRIKKAA